MLDMSTICANNRRLHCAVRRLHVDGRLLVFVHIANCARHQLLTRLQSGDAEVLHLSRHTENLLILKLSGLRVLHACHDSWATINLQALRENAGATQVRRFRETVRRFDLHAHRVDVRLCVSGAGPTLHLRRIHVRKSTRKPGHEWQEYLKISVILLQVAEHVNRWALMGFTVAIGMYFNVFYMISYGLGVAVASFDRIEAPSPPICIAHVNTYSTIWRHFDQGLYEYTHR